MKDESLKTTCKKKRFLKNLGIVPFHKSKIFSHTMHPSNNWAYKCVKNIMCLHTNCHKFPRTAMFFKVWSYSKIVSHINPISQISDISNLILNNFMTPPPQILFYLSPLRHIFSELGQINLNFIDTGFIIFIQKKDRP